MREFDRDPKTGLFPIRRPRQEGFYWLKRLAREMAAYALKCGIIRRAKVCENCERRRQQLSMHHKDYARPLEVRWLCAPCHAKADKERRGSEFPTVGALADVGNFPKRLLNSPSTATPHEVTDAKSREA